MRVPLGLWHDDMKDMAGRQAFRRTESLARTFFGMKAFIPRLTDVPDLTYIWGTGKVPSGLRRDDMKDSGYIFTVDLQRETGRVSAGL